MLVHVVSNLPIRALHASVTAPLRVSTSYEDRGVRMGKADVEEWVFASTVAPGDSDDTETEWVGQESHPCGLVGGRSNHPDESLVKQHEK
jgi:hypothetical protein